MDNKQAIKILEEQRDYDIFTRTEYRQQVHDALNCGIKALQAQTDGDIITALCSLPKIQSSDGQDYVQLFDVLETVKRYTAKADDGVAIPSAEPQVEQWKDFVLWVATEIFDDMWEYNKDAFAEIACRKLAELGIVRAKGDEWELVEPQERSDKE